MGIELVGVIAILAGFVGFFSGLVACLSFLTVAAVLQSAAAFFVLGANIPPGHVILGFLFLAVMANRETAGAVIRQISPDRPAFWLALMVFYGILSAYFVPRLMAGDTPIIPLGRTIHADTRGVVPLAPVSTNVTQSIYMLGNLLCFTLVAAIASTAQGMRAGVSALLAYCLASVFFALVDLATFATGTQFLIGFIRNAQYTLHVDDQIAGMKRIVGSFTEASAFARSTLGVLAFCGTLFLGGYRPVLTGVLSFSSALLVVLSTSSAGLAGAPVVLVLLYATAVLLAWRSRPSPAVALTIVAMPLIVVIATLSVALNDELWRTANDYVSLVVLDKAGSDSGVERGAWNTFAIRNVLDSAGLGLGLGTARTSSFLVALLVSVGVPGTVFYLIFAYQALVRPQRGLGSFEGIARLAACNGCLGLLVGDLVVSPSVDQGLFFYVLAAVSAAAPVKISRIVPNGALELRHAYRI